MRKAVIDITYRFVVDNYEHCDNQKEDIESIEYMYSRGSSFCGDNIIEAFTKYLKEAKLGIFY